MRRSQSGGDWEEIYIFKDFIYLVLERGREREREREKHQCVVASHVAPEGDLACNPGMCPDWESNRLPFGLQPTLNSLSYTSRSWGEVIFKKRDKCKDRRTL